MNVTIFHAMISMVIMVDKVVEVLVLRRSIQ